MRLEAFGTLERDTRGGWPSSVDGGYPLTYYCEDGGQLCPACANGENGSLASESETDPQWRLIGADVFYEGAPYACDHCGTIQESAYGDPDEDACPSCGGEIREVTDGNARERQVVHNPGCPEA